jgi:hypothetical protein
MDVLNLLERARAAGLRVAAKDGRLVVVGPRAAEALARELGAHKAERLSLLQEQRAEYERRRQAYQDAAEALDRIEDELAAARATGQDVAELEARWQEARAAWQRAARAFDEARSWPVAAEIRREIDAEVGADAETPPAWAERCQCMALAAAKGWPRVSIGWCDVGGDPGRWASFLYHAHERDVRKALAVLRGEAPAQEPPPLTATCRQCGERAPEGYGHCLRCLGYEAEAPSRCYACGGTAFWSPVPDDPGYMVCRTCHPAPGDPPPQRYHVPRRQKRGRKAPRVEGLRYDDPND